jgi:hypothetical protein
MCIKNTKNATVKFGWYAAYREEEVNCLVFNQALGHEGEGDSGYIAPRILNLDTTIPLREEPLESTERRVGGVHNRSCLCERVISLLLP